MELAGFNPRQEPDATYQAESLLLANAMAADTALAFSPPSVCPICELPLARRGEWLNQAAASIANERKPQ